jgi:hypothetical protein
MGRGRGRKPTDNATVKHVTTNITTSTKIVKQKISKTYATTPHTENYQSTKSQCTKTETFKEQSNTLALRTVCT